MSRPLRLDFNGALHYVTARGDRGEGIFLGDDDRRSLLEGVGEVCARFNWVIHAYCQMTNHYHLLVETPDGNLWRGMRQLNGIYTQRFNRRHSLSGHLFQGRYKAILVQKDAHLLELNRYVVLNSVRAGMVGDPADWAWSSYPAMLGMAPAPDWLDTVWSLSQFGVEQAQTVEAYRQFVLAGMGEASPLLRVRHQILLGDDEFVTHFQSHQRHEGLQEVSKAQRRVLALSLAGYRECYPDKTEAMARAFLSGAYTMAEIGTFFGVHYMTVSRAVKRFQQGEQLSIT